MVHAGTITPKDKTPGLQENLKKKFRYQKILILMMKRLSRTGVLLLPGNQEVETGVSNQNG
jgi:hypothetical protein